MADVPSLDLTAAASEELRLVEWLGLGAPGALGRRQALLNLAAREAAALEAALPATPAEPEHEATVSWMAGHRLYASGHYWECSCGAASYGHQTEDAAGWDMAKHLDPPAVALPATGGPVCTSPGTDCTNDCPYRPACVAAGGEATAAEMFAWLAEHGSVTLYSWPRRPTDPWTCVLDRVDPPVALDASSAIEAVRAVYEAARAVLRPLPADDQPS